VLVPKSSIKSVARKAKQSLVRNVEHRLGGFLGGPVFYGINGTFRNEQKAVMAGARAHYRSEGTHESRMFLRRSIHRLEKGMISRPMRSTFAADYIGPTVSTYISLTNTPGADAGELQWAHDVLEHYFKATADSVDRQVSKARHQWTSLEQDTTEEGEMLAPFPQPALQNVNEARAAFSALARHRRSVRWYTEREVPKHLVDDSIRVALTAPSACNRQSFRVVLVQSEPLKTRVATVPMGTAGFANQIPVLAVIIGQHRGYEHPRDRHAIYVDGGLFAAQFVLALEASGLNSCCINWPDLPDKEQELRGLLSMQPDERAVMMIAVGYGEPNQLVPRSHKRNVELVREWM
jgi:nitroreductase